MNGIAPSSSAPGGVVARIRARWRVPLLVLLALGWAAAAAAQQQGEQRADVWDLGRHESGRRLTTSVSAENSCRGRHDFEIRIEGDARRYLSIVGDPVLRGIDPGETKSAPAVIDLTDLPPGNYFEGRVVIRCLRCPETCKQDYQTLATRLVVTGHAAPRGGSGVAIAPGDVPGGTRPRCPAAQECKELYRLAREADERAAAASAKAQEDEELQEQRNQDADRLDEQARRERQDADKHRDDAKSYRQLAADARASAAQNRRRAAAAAPGSTYWRESNEAAATDDALATRRDADAAENEARARDLEELARQIEQRAEALRDTARKSRAAADEAALAADAAWKAFWDCIDRARAQCQPESEAGGSRTHSAPADGGPPPGTSGSGGTKAPPPVQPPSSPPPSSGGTTPPAPPRKPGGVYLGMREAVVCKWNTFRPESQPLDPRTKKTPEGEVSSETGPTVFVNGVQATRVLEMDDPSIIEFKFDLVEGHTRSATGFSYHCMAPGTVVVKYRRTTDLQHWEWRWVRIVCRDSYGWLWE